MNGAGAVYRGYSDDKPDIPLRHHSDHANAETDSPDEMKTEAQRVVQAMSPAQKLKAAERLYFSARQLKAAALRAQHPDWTDATIQHAVREVFLYARG